MILPCIDLMDQKVVQLIQGREKALERTIDEMLDLFRGFEQIQVIDLDAAMGRGTNSAAIQEIARRNTSLKLRVGGGVRNSDRAVELLGLGAHRIIVGTAAFSAEGPNEAFLKELTSKVGRDRVTIALDSKHGRIVVNGWKKETAWTAEQTIRGFEPFCSGFLCTYVDKEGMMQGTDLEWFRSLRQATEHELIAAGGITTMEDIAALTSMQIHCAIGMSIYTGKLSLDELRRQNQSATA
jgi:phosphoribosylformimino-5-aminoimidazole carboxamide ribotide isomerase